MITRSKDKVVPGNGKQSGRQEVNSDPGTQRLRKRRAQAPPPSSHTTEKRVQGSEAPTENRMESEVGLDGLVCLFNNASTAKEIPETIASTYKFIPDEIKVPEVEEGEVEEEATPYHENEDDDLIPKEMKFKHLLAVYDQKLVFYPNIFDCPVCFESIKENEGITLKECLHNFCRDCLINTVKICGEIEVKCPYRDENYTCESLLLETEIQGLLTEKEYDNRLKKTLEHAEMKMSYSFHCKKPDCSGWFINDGGITTFDCPVCFSQNCIICQAIHTPRSCEEYLDMVSLGSPASQIKRSESFLKIPKEMKFKHLLAVYDQKLVFYPNIFDCPVCFESIKENEGITLKECLHNFCRDCLINTVKICGEIEVKCPYRDENYTCESLLLETEIQGLLTEKEYDNRLKKTLEHAEMKMSYSFHCKKPDCSGWFINDGGITTFDCPVCFSQNCIICQAIHTPRSCEEYLDMVSLGSPASQIKRSESFLKIPKEMKFKHLLAVYDQKLVFYPNIFDCPVCFESIKENEGITLKECLHNFCRDCLINTVKICGEIEVKCPYRDENYTCESLLLETEIQGLLTEKEYDNRLKKTLEHAEMKMSYSFHCKKPDCSGWFINDGGITTFDCPVCFSQNCIICQAIHTPRSCEEYLDMVSLGSPASQIKRSESFLKIPKEMKFKHLLAVYDQKLVFYPNIFDCPVCFESIKENEGITLKECLHNFCRDCLINTVKICGEIEVKCPYRDENYTCESLLLETEIQGLLTEKEYDNRLKKTLEHAEMKMSYSFHCKKPDCSGWFINDGGITTFDCPVCFSQNCIICQAIHTPRSCEEYLDMVSLGSPASQIKRSESFLKDIVAQGTAMRCPQCTAVVQKEVGCDGMTCTICKTELCWATKGYRWGPGGKGDYSGGCMCNVDGRKCHPSCNNCH